LSRPHNVLVVEDDALLAMELDMVLSDLGVGLIGPARSVADGLAAIAARTVDGAILDISLDRESSEPIADCLQSAGIPFFYLTGHSARHLPAKHRDRPLVGKPFDEPALIREIRSMLRAPARMP